MELSQALGYMFVTFAVGATFGSWLRGKTAATEREMAELNIILPRSVMVKQLPYDQDREWEVKGHWRRMPDGRHVWVSPYRRRVE